MPGKKLHQSGPNVRPPLAGARHIGRMTFVPLPALRAICASALLLLLPFGSAALHAAPVAAGRMGATARATVQISVSVAPRLEVSRSLAVAAESGGAGTERFCVWSNTGVGSYSISASEAPDPGAGDPAGGGFAFDVQLAGLEAGTAPLSLAPGLSATGLRAEAQGACRSGRLVIRPANMAGDNPTARRSGALLLLIAPD
jgi:hypothetical protein